MARFTVCCLILVNAHLMITAAMSGNEEQPVIAEAPIGVGMGRKLGKHNVVGEIPVSGYSPIPSEKLKVDENEEFSREVSATGEESEVSQVLKINHQHQHHRSIDKSVAGGGVILGGLATTFFVAVFCYIRATRRRNAEPGSPTNPSIPSPKKQRQDLST